MNSELYEKVGVWFEEHREAMVSDITRLVRIESISQPGKDEMPFGCGCRQALDEMLEIGKEHGFDVENYDNIVGSIGSKEKNWENLVGFWNHLDVVPVGNGWEYAPFEPVVKGHFLIGRGAQDNKGPAVGILYMMQCLRELKIPLRHELCLFVGTDEERGMEDIEYYTAHYPTPKLSMIADSGFPVCYGEKGIIEGKMISVKCVTDQVLEVYGGSAGNMIPDRAGVLLRNSTALREELNRQLGAETCAGGEDAGRVVENREGANGRADEGKGGESSAEEGKGNEAGESSAEAEQGNEAGKSSVKAGKGNEAGKSSAEAGKENEAGKSSAEAEQGNEAGKSSVKAGKENEAGKSSAEAGKGSEAGESSAKAEKGSEDGGNKRAESIDANRNAIEWEASPEGIWIIGYGTSKHSAFPEGSVNAIHELSAFLMQLTSLHENDRTLFASVERLSREYYGKETGIAYEDAVSGKTTCAATVLSLEEGHLCLTLNIRYAITAKDDENLRTLQICGIANRMEWKLERNSKPNYFPKEHPAVERLTNLYQEITGSKAKSFVMGGGTYARKLPNAFAYGIGGMQENDTDREMKKRLFRPGHGGAHEPDEALNLRLLLEAMKIYTMAVVELNEIEL